MREIGLPGFRFKGFANQLIVIVAVLMLIPIALAFYLFHMVHSTEIGLIKSHRKVLEEAINSLDSSLNSSFSDIIRNANADNLPRRDQEKILNHALRPLVEKVAAKYPSIDIGFYSSDYDVILDGNDLHLHENFSSRRKRNFDDAVNNGNIVFEVLGQAENGQLEVYRPLIRDKKIIGAVWATESIKPIYKRIDEVQQVSYTIIITGFILAFGGTLSLVNNFARSISEIKRGLAKMSRESFYLLPKARGEMGQITDAINEMYKKLIDTQNYNELILSSIDDGIISVNLSCVITGYNQAASELFKFTDDILGKRIDEVFDGDSYQFGMYLASTLQDNKPVKDVAVVYRKNNNDIARHFLISTSLLNDAAGRLVGALLHVRDISEMVSLQESISRQERLAALGKMVAGVAHEIRSPLTSIAGYIQFWHKGHMPSAKSLQVVNRELARLSSVTEKLLQFARPSRAVLEAADLNQLVGRTVQLFSDAYGGNIKNFTMHCSLAENLPRALMDAQQIEQVLINILYNSFQALQGDGRIEVSTAFDQDKRMLVLSVQDNGCGIPEEIIPEIFEPFFTTKSKGTGLGLAIAREIIEAHNGLIEISSKLSEGTTVRIYLPFVHDKGEEGEDE